jgi:hypothetical protein
VARGPAGGRELPPGPTWQRDMVEAAQARWYGPKVGCAAELGRGKRG